jgi:hypothetical protein
VPEVRVIRKEWLTCRDRLPTMRFPALGMEGEEKMKGRRPSEPSSLW